MNRRSFIKFIVAIPAALVALKATASIKQEDVITLEDIKRCREILNNKKVKWPYEGAVRFDFDTGLANHFINGKWQGWHRRIT